MEVDLAGVITAISKNKSIRHLYLARSVPANMKSKHLAAVTESLVFLLQEDCVLQSLMLPDSRLKTDMHNLINALGSNSCLQTLDIRYTPLETIVEFLAIFRVCRKKNILNRPVKCKVILVDSWT